MSFLLDSTLKVSVIVLVALGATVLLRRRSAAVRHWVLAVAVVCAAAAPLLGLVMPPWHARLGTLPAASQGERAGSVDSLTTVQVAIPVGRAPSWAPAATSASTERVMFAALGSIWLVGACVSFLILLVGLVRLKRLASGAQRVERGRWVDLTREISGAFGLRRSIVLLQSDHPMLLVTWGLTRPKVILPATASSWPEDRARIVLRHELAHIQRGDWVVQMAAEVLRSVFWFNPLVWFASARLRQESEYACDDAVLDGAVDAADYAGHLLDLARTFHAERRSELALAMARPSSLEGRIRAMLNANVDRKPLTRSFRLITVIALLSLTLPIAGLVAQNTFVTVSGSVLDGTNHVFPNVTLVLTKTGNRAKHEVRSDNTGHFEFVGVPAGEYVLETEALGFAPFRDQVMVAGRNITRNIELHVASLQETINVTDQGGQRASAGQTENPSTDQTEKAQLMRQRAQDMLQRAVEKCVSNGAGPIGGSIVPPQKLMDVKPRYPENLRSANVGGVVVLDALLATDGSVKDVQGVSSPDPDLQNAAMEAVRQWQFSSTLLNCAPIEVRMQVTVNFKANHP